jgi:hypothetical protein
MGTSIPVNFTYADGGAGDPSSLGPNDTISFLPVNDNELLIVDLSSQHCERLQSRQQGHPRHDVYRPRTPCGELPSSNTSHRIPAWVIKVAVLSKLSWRLRAQIEGECGGQFSEYFLLSGQALPRRAISFH